MRKRKGSTGFEYFYFWLLIAAFAVYYWYVTALLLVGVLVYSYSQVRAEGGD